MKKEKMGKQCGGVKRGGIKKRKKSEVTLKNTRVKEQQIEK